MKRKNSTRILLTVLWPVALVIAHAEPTFDWIPIGDSAVLIKWTLPENKRNGSSVFTFAINKITSGDEEDEFLRRTLVTPYELNSIIFSSFETDTAYKIRATISGKNFPTPFETVFSVRTNKETNDVPLKPDFEYEIQMEPLAYPIVKITWLPCGKQNCSKGVAGNFFYLRYSEKDESGFVNVRPFRGDIAIINRCRPGKVYKVMVISVLGDKETESDVKEITVPEGASNFEIKEALTNENTTLSCKLRTSSTDHISWDLSSRSADASELTYLENGDVSIREISVFDGGLYVCHAKDNPNNSFAVYLDPKVATRIDNAAEFDYRRVRSGQVFRMDCVVSSDRSLAYSVRWLKDGKRVDLDANGKFAKARNNSLLISKMDKEDSGNYTCLVNTRLDSVNATLTANVI